jgi:uncharacterized protein (TIGR00255 family)
MTGYGTGTASVEGCVIAVSARAVNHRYFDVRTKMPPELLDFTDVVERVARQQISRGRVEVTVRLERPAGEEITLATNRAMAAISQLRVLRDQTAPGEALPLGLLAAVPGLFSEATPLAPDLLRDALHRALEQAFNALNEMRRTEGAALTNDLLARLQRLRELGGSIAGRAPDLVAQYRTKLHARIAKLLSDGSLASDPARLETEVAIFADRADVTEEITRLNAHCDHFADIAASDDAVGRTLDFLLQEMGREANTIGSKISDASITHLVVEIKTELERVREQVQNVL